MDNMINTQDKLQFFSAIIDIGLNTIIPAKKVKLHRNDVPWMTGHLKLLIKKRQEALEQSNHALFRFYRNRVNKDRKLCKSKYYQSKMEELGDSNCKEWWKECKRLCGMVKKNNDIATTLLDSPDFQEKLVLANQINKAFLQPQQSYQPLDTSRRFDTSNAIVPSVLLESVTTQLKKISISKSNGPENFPNWILKDYSDILAAPVTSIINSSLQEEKLPSLWKSADVVPLPKSEQVKDLTKDLKPISLTPTLSKITEDYVVQAHVKPPVLEHIGSDQYGCVPQSSTSTYSYDY